MPIPEKETQMLEGLTSYWTDRAHSYSAQNIEEMNDWRQTAWRKLILDHAPQKEHLRILDVGTGPGFFAMMLALAGHEVTAVDATEHMLWHAADNARAYGAEVNFVLHRGEFLPFEDECFDLIVSRNVVWNLEFPEQALADWKRVLVPGGRMVYFDANWYLYLFDDQLREEKARKREAFLQKYPEQRGRWEVNPERTRDLEKMALSLPLSSQERPAWDVQMMKKLGMRLLEVFEQVGRGVQAQIEYERDDPTQMFMICAEK